MKMTPLFFLPLFILLSACAGKSTLDKPSVRSTAPVTLAFDSKYSGTKLENYRKNLELKMSASATFGPKALKELTRPLKKNKLTLYVFDLRQESHGLINDQPVTWESERNWGQAGLTHEEAIRHERRLLGELRVGDKIGTTEIKSIETEESMIRSAGHQYVRLTVTEGVRPTDSEVDLFVEAQRGLPVNAWVHFHDRGGKGRTTVFMILYDMLVSAKYISLNEILKRNMELSQDADALAVGDSKDWKYPYQKEQADFIHEFYNYAKAYPRGEGMLWSEWVQR